MIRGPGLRRSLAVAAALSTVAAAAYLVALAVAVALVQCDEACDIGRASQFRWWVLRGSWQWYAQTLPPLASLVLALRLTRDVRAARLRAAVAKGCAMVASYALWVFLLLPWLAH